MAAMDAHQHDRRITASIDVAAPADRVFDILSRPREHGRIDGSGSVGSVIEGPERLTAKGDRFRVAMRMYGVPYRIENRVVELEPGRLIAWRHFGGHRWRYELTPGADGGTRVTETFDYSRYNRLWSRVIELAGFPARNRRGIEATLVRLKAAAESDAAAEAPLSE